MPESRGCGPPANAPSCHPSAPRASRRRSPGFLAGLPDLSGLIESRRSVHESSPWPEVACTTVTWQRVRRARAQLPAVGAPACRGRGSAAVHRLRGRRLLEPAPHHDPRPVGARIVPYTDDRGNRLLNYEDHAHSDTLVPARTSGITISQYRVDGTAAPYRVPFRQSRGPMTNGRRQKRACGAVSLRRHCPDQVLGGRRSAFQLSGLSAFSPGSGSPRHSVWPSSLDHLADNPHAAWRQ